MTNFVSTLESTRSARRPWLKSRRGWLGIDIGTGTTKLAQLDRIGDRLQMTAHWLIDDYGGEPLNKDLVQSGGSLPFRFQLREARSMFRGRCCAAALPLSLTELRLMELPAGNDDELRNMIHEELQSDINGSVDHCFDYLPTQPSDSSEGDMGTFSVFATPAVIANCAADVINQAGLDCEVLDSLPCALARAARLCEPDDNCTPLAVLDIGHTSSLLVVARAGQLLFGRQLRGCNLQMLLKPLQDGLKLSPAEAQQLLCHHAKISRQDLSPVSPLATAAHGVIAEPLARTIAEVKRTLDFLDLQFRSVVPKKLILCGGGALVPALVSALAEETALPTRLWALPSENDRPFPEQALFAVAAALSSLAWEAESCM